MLFEFRRVQEMSASSLAATRATPSELRTVEVAMEQCRHGFVHHQVEVFNQADEDFHTAVAMASHNTLLVSAVREARRLQRQSSAIGLHDTLGENTRAAVEETRPSTVPSATATPSRRRRPPRPPRPDFGRLPAGDPAAPVRAEGGRPPGPRTTLPKR
jgi:hypothetical protein